MIRRTSAFTARPRGAEGFTLVEALVAVALTGFILVSLATVTGQWLPQWRFGFARVQRLEMLKVGLRRVIDDLDAAEFITANSQTKTLMFIGDSASVMLVRVAGSPGVAPRLELVRLAPGRDERGAALIRTQAPFAPMISALAFADQFRFSDPVALVRAPYSVRFAYAGPDLVWRESWHDSVTLPYAIRVQALDARTGASLAASTATHPQVDAPTACIGQKSLRECLSGLETSAPALGGPNTSNPTSEKLEP